jgi:hypothetical protein
MTENVEKIGELIHEECCHTIHELGDTNEKKCDEKDRNFGATTTGSFTMTMRPPTHL